MASRCHGLTGVRKLTKTRNEEQMKQWTYSKGSYWREVDDRRIRGTIYQEETSTTAELVDILVTATNLKELDLLREKIVNALNG